MQKMGCIFQLISVQTNHVFKKIPWNNFNENIEVICILSLKV